MKNRGDGGDGGDRGDELFPTEDELEVSVILLELPELAERSQNQFFNVRWGAKKRRSAEEDYSSPAATAAAPTVSGGGGKSHPKVEASSPATPLCFSPSDTECKSRPSRRSVAKKKSTKELMEMVRALGDQQEQLKLEISKVIKYRDGLIDENLQLKSKQLKMKHRYGDPLDGRVDEGDLLPTATRAAAPKPDRAPPSTAAQPAENLRRREETARPAENLLRRREGTASYVHVADLRYRAVEIPYAGIPDLNCSVAEEAGEEAAVGFDFYGYEAANKAAAAAQAAQARKRRLEIHRVKNSAAFKSQHYHLQPQQQQRLR